jgi:biopolymer transport protein ExbB/TolQ
MIMLIMMTMMIMLIMMTMMMIMIIMIIITEFSAYFRSSHSFKDKSSFPADFARDRYPSPVVQCYKK